MGVQSCLKGASVAAQGSAERYPLPGHQGRLRTGPAGDREHAASRPHRHEPV